MAPTVFLITGWGEPDSAPDRNNQNLHPDDDSDVRSMSSSATLNDNPPSARRTFTSWCAVHRPKPDPAAPSNLVIIEFELEKDDANPLYPPPDYNNDADASSGTSSGHSGSTDGSERTMVGQPYARSTNDEVSDAPPQEQPHSITESQAIRDSALSDSERSTSGATYFDSAHPGVGTPPRIAVGDGNDDDNGDGDGDGYDSDGSLDSGHSFATALSSFGASQADLTRTDQHGHPPFMDHTTSSLFVGTLSPSAISAVPHASMSPNAAGALAPRADWQPVIPTSLQGLAGGEDWVPSPEDVLESTTSTAKPLGALERLRRLAKGTGPGGLHEVDDGPSNTRRARRRRMSNMQGNSEGGGGVGMLDVFTVQEQINEQVSVKSLHYFQRRKLSLISSALPRISTHS